jgi:predicted transcriptional regulator
MSESTTITVRVDQSTKDRLDAVARSSRRSRSFLAAEAIEEYLAVQEWQMQGIRQGLRSLEEGKGIPHSKVSEWVRSWGKPDERAKPKPNR